MTRRGRIPKGLLSICCALAGATAAGPPEVRIRSGPWFPPGLVISAEANLVEMGVTVRDHSGRPVGGLSAKDFEVLDDNHPREITVFAEQRFAPASTKAPALPTGLSASVTATTPAAAQGRSIGLFFDDVHATMAGLHYSANAAQHLIEGGLQPADRIAIYTASGTIDVDFTADSARLLSALAYLRPHPPAVVRMSDECPKLTAYQAYVIEKHIDLRAKQVAVAEAVACKCPDPTPECVRAQEGYVQDLAGIVWDASKFDSINVLEVVGIVLRHVASAPPKRMLVLMTPGLLTGGLEEHTSALVDVALRSNVTISAMNTEGLTAPSMKPSLHDRWEDRAIGQRELILSEFPSAAAQSTGGKYIHDFNDLTAGLRSVTAVPEVSYLLGFAAGRADGKFHALKTRLRASHGYSVEARGGYFSAGLTKETETTQQRIDRIAQSGDSVDNFPATLRLGQAAGAADQATLNVTVSVDAAGLKFPGHEGRHLEELTFLTVLEDAQGSFLSGKQSVMDLAVLPPTLARYRKSGIQVATCFPAKRGSYRVREVIREATQDHVWASTASIDIR